MVPVFLQRVVVVYGGGVPLFVDATEQNENRVNPGISLDLGERGKQFLMAYI